ncbi:MAG: site-specific DNA-methyltransferase, partial [Candidatus Micrarchaeota archaeon]
GSVYIHLDHHTAHYVKIILDEIFGSENFINELVWQKIRTTKAQTVGFGNVHDSIFIYGKNPNIFFQNQYREFDENYIKTHYKKDSESGRLYRTVSMIQTGQGPARRFGDKLLEPPPGRHWIWSQERIDQALKDGLIRFTSSGRPEKIQYLDEMPGDIVDDLWSDIFPINSQATEALKYPTQKPEALLERIINSSSTENSLVADFFCGSGTTAAVAERLGRRWITSDLSKTAIQVARARFVKQDAKPFVIENLGNYQRQLIYLHEVKLKEMYDIILNLYGATPRTDKQGVGISVSDRSTLVYVCEPDRPMTARKAIDLAKEALNLDGKGYKHLVILAWDYDYNYDEDLKRVTKSGGKLADIESKIIPSDVYKYLRSTKVGDPSLSEKITFYQKPYVKISEPKIISKDGDDQIVKLSIEQYVVMDNPVRDEEKRKEVETLLRKNYAYLIDFWSVDWNYDGEVFRSRWQAIRDRKSKEPVVTSADFRLKKGKKYKVALRVVDVFGNDASAVKEIDLR